MHLSFSGLSDQRKALLVELLCLFILNVLIPFSIGSQLWPDYSYTFSLIFVTMLTVPSTILFYRWFLPFTLEKRRYGLFLLLLPFFVVVYEINARLANIIGMSLPFIPKGYRANLASSHPASFKDHILILNIGYACLVLFSVASLYMVRQLYKKQRRVYALENDKLKLELTQLRSQLQPHFFFNTLNNLYSLSTEGSPKTSAMIADLSGIMRYVLYESQQEKVPLQKEVDFIRSYIRLEKIRHDDADIIVFDVQGDISSTWIESLLFLPIIENAFKHSLAKELPGKYVKLVLAADEDELVFQASNPYPEKEAVGEGGSAGAAGTEAGGIGLRNIRKRLELLYPGRHQLEIDRADGLFNVLLTIRSFHKK